ncbi:uncharacterized protein LOC134530202 [Bacillus rossius redtenbacheri]|uniref:uncharacterized protein LOC134530202 n=1 Tax=Bacillus rossius redtenbacheri TaxID=93214 RepID=UPI002FDE6293
MSICLTFISAGTLLQNVPSELHWWDMSGDIEGSQGLRLLDIRVPQYGELHGSVTMTCDFKLEDTKLYSVKWYKNDFEFFRYIPDNSPQTQSLPVPGILLDLSSSNMTTITLIRLGFNSSGTYRCEVSTEAPDFKTVVGSGDLSVRGESPA